MAVAILMATKILLVFLWGKCVEGNLPVIACMFVTRKLTLFQRVFIPVISNFSVYSY
jgi:hypothetical protein